MQDGQLAPTLNRVWNSGEFTLFSAVNVYEGIRGAENWTKWCAG